MGFRSGTQPAVIAGRGLCRIRWAVARSLSDIARCAVTTGRPRSGWRVNERHDHLRRACFRALVRARSTVPRPGSGCLTRHEVYPPSSAEIAMVARPSSGHSERARESLPIVRACGSKVWRGRRAREVGHARRPKGEALRPVVRWWTLFALVSCYSCRRCGERAPRRQWRILSWHFSPNVRSPVELVEVSRSSSCLQTEP